MVVKRKLLLILIPALMLSFLVRNIYLVETNNLDSWMGGGMRMFANIDKMLYRVSGFEVNYNEGTYFVNLRSIPEFGDDDVELRILPSEERLKKTLKKIKQAKWYYNPEKNTVSLQKMNEQSYLINNKLITKIEVFTTAFDSKNKQIKLKSINYAE